MTSKVEGTIEDMMADMRKSGCTEAQLIAVDTIYRAMEQYAKRCCDEKQTMGQAFYALGEAMGNGMIEFLYSVGCPDYRGRDAIHTIIAHMSATSGSAIAESVNAKELLFAIPERTKH